MMPGEPMPKSSVLRLPRMVPSQASHNAFTDAGGAELPDTAYRCRLGHDHETLLRGGECNVIIAVPGTGFYGGRYCWHKVEEVKR